MTEQFPEETLSENKQYELLLQRLAGNEALASWRKGLQKRGDSAFPGVIELAEESRSPSAFIRGWEKIAGIQRVLGNIIAQLKRDGHGEAVTALINTLKHGIPLPGEIEPITDLTHMHFVMPDAGEILPALLSHKGSGRENYQRWRRPGFDHSDWLGSWSAGMVTSQDIKVIMSSFTREEQKNLAIWTLVIPTYTWKYIMNGGVVLKHAILYRPKDKGLVKELLDKDWNFGLHISNEALDCNLWVGDSDDYWDLNTDSSGYTNHALDSVFLYRSLGVSIYHRSGEAHPTIKKRHLMWWM